MRRFGRVPGQFPADPAQTQLPAAAAAPLFRDETQKAGLLNLLDFQAILDIDTMPLRAS